MSTNRLLAIAALVAAILSFVVPLPLAVAVILLALALLV